ncbi:MAG: DUF3806 domain-containing protein, partial [Pseudomonadota bacterium]
KANDSDRLDIETPEGSVSATRTTVDHVPQEIQPVSDEVLEMFRDLSELGPEFAKSYVPGSSESGLKLYDQAFSAWQLAESKAHSDQQVVEILGGVLGNRLVDDFDMEWVVVHDEYGVDYAVRGKTIDVMAFPFSTVLKRITNVEHDFMYGVYYTVKDRIASGEYTER